MGMNEVNKFALFCLHWSCSPTTSRGRAAQMQTKQIKLGSRYEVANGAKRVTNLNQPKGNNTVIRYFAAILLSRTAGHQY